MPQAKLAESEDWEAPPLKEAINLKFRRFDINGSGEEVAIFQKSIGRGKNAKIAFTKIQLQEYTSAVKGSWLGTKGKTLEFDERYYKHLEKVLVEWVMGK